MQIRGPFVKRRGTTRSVHLTSRERNASPIRLLLHVEPKIVQRSWMTQAQMGVSGDGGGGLGNTNTAHTFWWNAKLAVSLSGIWWGASE